MSRKEKESSVLADRFYEKVFKIKLKGAQEVNLTPEIMKAIEQEYAIKYLESLNIEPTKANIALILKENPLKNCQFGAGWNNGRIVDTLTIIAREKKTKNNYEKEEQEIAKAAQKASNDLKQLETKLSKEEAKGNTDLTKQGKNQNSDGKNKGQKVTFQDGHDALDNVQPEDEAKFKLDYDIGSIKTKYLYPFNQSKQRKAYQNLMDDPSTSYLPQIEKGNNNDVLNPLKYYFPFSHVKVPSLILKELQVPLKVTAADIAKELKKFTESFPFEIIPHQKTKAESEPSNTTFQTPPDSRATDRAIPVMKERSGTFLKDIDIDKCKSLLTSEEMARVVGVVNHLAYWQTFGHLCPVQPDTATKKQMVLISMDQLNQLKKKVKNAKLWSLFVLPMIVLAIRMLVEYLLRNSYSGFFEIEQPCAIALEKINLLISNMLDPNMLYSRFAFFESEIQAVNKKFTEHLDENKFRNKRIYGTNPYLDLYFPRPESDFVRNIQQKRRTNASKTFKGKPGPDMEKEMDEVEEDEGTQGTTLSKEYLQQSYKVKMFQVLLDSLEGNEPTNLKRKAGVLNFDREKLCM